MNLGIWANWYNLPEQGREEYFAWLYNSYILRILSRPGVKSAAHYGSISGEPQQRKHLQPTPDKTVPVGDRFILLFESETPYAFANPMPSRYHETLGEADRKMLSLRIGERSNVMTIEARVLGPEANGNGDLPFAPAIQMGSFNAGSWKDEDELGDWYAHWRLPCCEKLPGCIRVRKLVSISGWAKHAVLYEFTSTEARAKNYVGHEKNNPQMDQWTERVVNKLVHAPGSPNVAKRLWPPVAA